MSRLFTSNQTEVVSLPVNKYCPTNIVSPGFSACKEPDDIAYLHECVNMSSNWDLLVAIAIQVNADSE